MVGLHERMSSKACFGWGYFGYHVGSSGMFAASETKRGMTRYPCFVVVGRLWNHVGFAWY